ncbi:MULTISPECIES: SecY-interacting protein [unclassified Colwellia]|uniref:SecY-interacting protein n=1 Tax=unclassified Colwellia TaxID=196834 RepID=UPI0015F6706C|nr:MULTISPECIES: SecY-interacting protein [unclassified Colwellia]MBA6348788.1 SecY-interacting protein [Colwellia sp. BRX8-9]MBA6357360.1 SecY-interacting protein [Colwellia sp. BRX8-3]MBA6359580.1 SecY-interacting protein [Colwellia sp. BRX8-6]MBA6367461.1 SecY-interacting protein [Colwellia sp. BRX8-5]MBA6373780.1 SecY-interacting protein [Colwellia sp. BRX8-2]
MKSSPCELMQSLSLFSQKYLSQYQERYQHLPLIEKDEQWPSPCLSDDYDENHQYWQPCEISDPINFDNVEKALEITINADFKTYFTSLYSDTLDASCEEGALSLLFAWSKDDFQRLQENVIGHILMKQKLKQPLTLFFALTDDDNMILSVNNDNGEIWVEKVGAKAHKKVADSLVSFINMLSPRIP